jgi:hypothetical protein
MARAHCAFVLLLLWLVFVGTTARANPGLGFYCRDLTRAEQNQVSGAKPLGSFVLTVYPGSPAAAGGLLPLDRIVVVNGQTAFNNASLGRLLGPAKATGEVRLTVQRGSERSLVTIRPADQFSYLGIAARPAVLRPARTSPRPTFTAWALPGTRRAPWTFGGAPATPATHGPA